MKKLLLCFLMIIAEFQIYAQLSCGSPIVITTNGDYVAPAITGTYANNCIPYVTTYANNPIKGIWYSFTPTSNGEITIFSANTLSRLSVFKGNCSNLECYATIGENEDWGWIGYVVLTFPVEMNETYYISWHNYYEPGEFTFNFNFHDCNKPLYINEETNLTTTSVTLNWDEAIDNPANYDIEYGISGYWHDFYYFYFPFVTSSTNSYNLAGLDNDYYYDYYIRSVCEPSNKSGWNGPHTFILPKICPYYSGFDSDTEYNGWKTIQSTPFSQPTISFGSSSITSHSPPTFLQLKNSSTVTVNNWLFSRGLLLAANESVIVSFYVKTIAGANRSLKLTVGNAQTEAAQTTTIWSSTTVTSNPNYTQITTPAFVAPTAGIYYFAFNDFSPITTSGNLNIMRLDTVNFTSILSTNDFESSDFLVYPNPVRDIVFISNSENILISDIQLTDLNGREMKKIKGNNSGAIQINISDLASGIYMMNISSDLGSTTKKIVKE